MPPGSNEYEYVQTEMPQAGSEIPELSWWSKSSRGMLRPVNTCRAPNLLAVNGNRAQI